MSREPHGVPVLKPGRSSHGHTGKVRRPASPAGRGRAGRPTVDSAAMADPVDASATDVPLPRLVLELRDLVVAYFRQETVVPLKSLGRYVLFGVGGALLLGTGVILLGVGSLRLLQAETGSTFRGDWSWAPYGIVFVALIVGGAITWRARRARRARA